MRLVLPTLFLVLFFGSCTPKSFITGHDLYKADNLPILKSTMSDSLYNATEGRHVNKKNRAIKTKIEAFELAKPAFIEKVGYNENILDRLYAIDLVHGFWIVKGMLPRGYTGGTLVAVIDSESGVLLYSFIWK